MSSRSPRKKGAKRTAVDLRDPVEFRRIHDENAKKLFNLAMRLVGDRGRAEEIVQETFLRAYDKAETFRAGARVSTWLYRICANLSYDYLRAKRYREYIPLESRAMGDEGEMGALSDRLPASVPAPPQEAGRLEVKAAVQRLIDELPEREKTVIVLRHYYGMTFDRIAESMGLTSRTVQNCLRRARTKLFYGLRREGITAAEIR